jgi:hypothetical protein
MGFKNLPAIFLVREPDSVCGEAHCQSQFPPDFDDIKQVLPNRGFAAKKLDRGFGIISGKVFEYLCEILQGRIKNKTHAGSIVDADRTIEIAAIGNIQKDDIGILVMTSQTIEFTRSGLGSDIKIPFLYIPLCISGDKNFGSAAAGAILHEINVISSLFPPGGDKILTFLA